MSLIRCKKCRGTKKLMGMGSIYKNCDECNGVGQVDVEDAEVTLANPAKVANPVIDPALDGNIPPIKKKPSKKKKQIQLDMTKPENAYV